MAEHRAEASLIRKPIDETKDETMIALFTMTAVTAAIAGPLALAVAEVNLEALRTQYIAVWVRFQNAVERVERNESNLEHASNELLFELPHLSEQVPHLVAAIMN